MVLIVLMIITGTIEKKKTWIQKENKKFFFHKIDICDYDSFQKLLNKRFDVAITYVLAGVRYFL